MAMAYVPVEPRQVAHTTPCAYCGTPVPFERVEVPGGPFWGLEAMVAGAGSDHLATWCADCGPLHRRLRESRSHFEHMADLKLYAAARMWERVAQRLAGRAHRAWSQLADNPIGWTDPAGNVLAERGPGYYVARTSEGEEWTVWAPTPYI